MPWANDGSNQWNATRCVPLDPSARPAGAPCTVEGYVASGFDNCDRTSMCWHVDPQTLQGVCVPFCSMDPEMPCPDGRACLVLFDGVVTVCTASCDPFLQGCAYGDACRLLDLRYGFVCAPASDTATEPGDPCDAGGTCAPGLSCVSTGLVPGCTDPAGCCVPFCDTTAPDADAACDAVFATPGAACVPLFAPGNGPPGQTHVGQCRLPA